MEEICRQTGNNILAIYHGPVVDYDTDDIGAMDKEVPVDDDTTLISGG